jgi:hypothetical protein
LWPIRKRRRTHSKARKDENTKEHQGLNGGGLVFRLDRVHSRYVTLAAPGAARGHYQTLDRKPKPDRRGRPVEQEVHPDPIVFFVFPFFRGFVLSCFRDPHRIVLKKHLTSSRPRMDPRPFRLAAEFDLLTTISVHYRGNDGSGTS